MPPKRAREKRDDARRLLADGVDPSAHRKIGEQAKAETFEVIAREWLEKRAKTSAAITMQKAQWLLEMIFPRIGKRPIREVSAPELLQCFGRLSRVGTMRRLIGLSRSVGRCFDTPLLPVAPSGTSALICGVPWFRS